MRGTTHPISSLAFSAGGQVSSLGSFMNFTSIPKKECELDQTGYIVEKITQAVLYGIMAVVGLYFFFRKRPPK